MNFSGIAKTVLKELTETTQKPEPSASKPNVVATNLGIEIARLIQKREQFNVSLNQLSRMVDLIEERIIKLRTKLEEQCKQESDGR